MQQHAVDSIGAFHDARTRRASWGRAPSTQGCSIARMRSFLPPPAATTAWLLPRKITHIAPPNQRVNRTPLKVWVLHLQGGGSMRS